MITMPSNEHATETAPDTQDTETVASVKLDDVTGGWWNGPGPYGAPYAPYASYASCAPYAAYRGGGWGSYGSPYGGAPRYAAYERRAQWYAANSPRFASWWG